ncbi:small secreted protein [Streptomyces tirandamycinicus]|uniref:Small secreted protein n=1 Tax=Streptomyces tirandamycinicus TaxID=2174846 RepID=A0A2S1SUV4_9ACTN|nr:small secreted protein [Streptomyces tirandamycinicus]
MKVNRKFSAAVSGGALLVLALTGCGDGDDSAKVDAWAKSVCEKAQPQIQKRADARQAIISTSVDGKPADIQAADSKAFKDIADANRALASAVQAAGTPPGEGQEQLQQDAIKELNATATAYLDLKKKVDELDPKDQQEFADGLKDVAKGLKKIQKTDQVALGKLQSGDLGKAMGKQKGCQRARPSVTPPPAAGDGPSEPSGKPSNAAGPSKSAGSAEPEASE